MMDFEFVKYTFFYFLAFIHLQVYQVYDKFINHSNRAVGMSLEFFSHTGGIYQGRCLFQKGTGYISGGLYLGQGSRSSMSFGQSAFVSPIPSWAHCVWKSGVKDEWNEDESESRGISHAVNLDLLSLVPPSVFAEIRANKSKVVRKHLELGLDFDDSALYPRWKIYAWEYDPNEYKQKPTSHVSR